MRKRKLWKRLGSILCVSSLMMNMTSMPVLADSDNTKILNQNALYNAQTVEITQPKATDSSYDPRPLGILPPVRSQGSYGTCWAHSVAALIEISMIRKGMATPETANISELHMAYFRYNYTPDPLGGTEGDLVVETSSSSLFSGAGSPTDTINQLAAWMGPVAESKYPYEAAGYVNEVLQNTQEHAWAEREALLYEAGVVPFHDIDAMKEAIVKYGALGTSYYSNWSTSYENGETYGRYCPTTRAANHAVTIVGWDDDFPRDNFGNIKPENDGAWLVRNSYGTGRWDGGYFWLSYKDWSMLPAFYIDVVAPDTYHNNYQYDNNLASNSMESSGQSPVIYGANIFTAHANEGKQEDLVAVSFDTPYPNLNYSIEIYKDLTDLSDPTSGEKVLEEPLTGEKLPTGRFTRDLPEAVALNQGDVFSVVIKYTHSEPQSTPALCLENSITSSKAGQSFSSIDGENWKDLGNEGKGNLRIKAFTRNTDRLETTETPYLISVTSRLQGTAETVANISMNPSRGYIEKGDSVTVTAPNMLRYKFKGWYLLENIDENTNELKKNVQSQSEKYSYTFTPDENTSLVAVYESIEEAKATLSLSGSNYTVTVNGVKTEVEGDGYTGTPAIGSKVTIEVKNDGFINWLNENNKIVTTEKTYTFTVTGNSSLKMSRKGTTANVALINFVSEYNQVIASQICGSVDRITFPENKPSKKGYTFTGWSLTEAQIREKIAAGENHITVTPVYEQNKEMYDVTVYIDEVMDEMQSDTEILAGTTKTVLAPALDGKEFLYWTDENENILGYDMDYFMQINKDIVMKAVYGEEQIEVKPVIAITDIDTTDDGSNKKISFSATRDVPEGYTLVEHGIIANRDGFENPTEENFVMGADAVTTFKASGILTSGVYTLNIKMTGKEDKKVVVRGYLIVKNDKTDNEEIYYTDVVIRSYNDVNVKES